MILTIPVLSICIPAYNRPEWLKRALISIMKVNAEFYQEVEIIVSDDSSDPSCGEIAQTILKKWSGKWQYQANFPRLGMAQNWNNGIKMASGKYVLVLHDDDFLLTNSIENILKKIKDFKELYPVLLFGVQVVNEQEHILKIQTFSKERYLYPKNALIHLLSNSSFVRFPAIVINKKVFEEVGYFNPEWGEPTDIDMWIRLFSQYGVCCIPITTCAYTVHSQALTMGLFNENTIRTLLEFFDRVATLNLLSSSELNNCQAKFFHQFILAGSFRKLRRGQLKEFHQIIQLFDLPIIKDLKPPKKWLMVRYFMNFLNFAMVTVGLIK
ncbi:glycosyltransferase family 2 protein [Aphanothece sacrum]|uniref:Glycosyl transferase n=1 Tax=Aphanothece sacrum FPU1 TaxID=1920663 RepID=A0A401ID87_APHSA|nr:glycosyltransferase family 2 protein [Aphanothece sacrum]GBF79196.1 glycosyl transferase [Aphanothece sacrum FPU1]GBF86586.1 glycosyl transferase [Aphanothece sacrum FPU3]